MKVNKKIKNIFLVFLFAILLVNYAKSQVGFNNPLPDASSVVDIKASDRGILIPRLTTVQRAAMFFSAPQEANGLLLFDLDLNRFYTCYSGAPTWLALNPWETEDKGGSPVTPKNMYTLVVGNTGIGSTTPKSKLSVAGNMSVGSAYAGTVAAPTNSMAIEGDASIAGTVDANNYTLTGANSNGPAPTGLIGMWSGAIATIPTGWALCDGQNGTPDLRERFIVGAGGNNASVAGIGYTVTNTGGEVTHTLTIAEMPSHSHGGNTIAAGSHDHGGSTASGGVDATNSSTTGYALVQSGSDGCGGAGSSHTHTIASDGNHTHSINAQGGNSSHENRPPYFALAYIMKL